MSHNAFRDSCNVFPLNTDITGLVGLQIAHGGNASRMEHARADRTIGRRMGVTESCTAESWEESEWDRDRRCTHRPQVGTVTCLPAGRSERHMATHPLRRTLEPAVLRGNAPHWSARSLPALAERPTVVATAGPREHRPPPHAAAGNPSDKSDRSDPTRCFRVTARRDQRSST
jgi:hypothetical protein